MSFHITTLTQTLSRVWNKRTQGWLERYTYLRTGRSLTATYFISAFWHGLYPGFFLFFMSIPLMTNIERLIKVRTPIFKNLLFNSIFQYFLIYLLNYWFIYLFIYLHVLMFIYFCVYLFIYWLIYFFVCIFNRLFIFFFNFLPFTKNNISSSFRPPVKDQSLCCPWIWRLQHHHLSEDIGCKSVLGHVLGLHYCDDELRCAGRDFDIFLFVILHTQSFLL